MLHSWLLKELILCYVTFQDRQSLVFQRHSGLTTMPMEKHIRRMKDEICRQNYVYFTCTWQLLDANKKVMVSYKNFCRLAKTWR